MNNVLNNFKKENIDKFFEFNPEFNNTILKDFKSVDLWALALFCETFNNKLYNLPDVQRKHSITVLLDNNIDWKILDPVISTYNDLTKSSIEKQLFAIECKLQERTTLFETTEYTFENAEKLDKLIIASGKIQEEYKKLKDRVENENSGENEVKGGRKLSLSEKGGLI